ncbi:MAG: 16S rRNA (guanine(966)-N(2))-methyltransferase RsmD [Acidimicrobiales bacterium]
MRVVAGTARGRRLVAPRGRDTRPTSDRVREALFNALGSLDVVDGARVLDLFAGSGALGIEALSRGAAHATFVERDERAVEAIWANLVATGLTDRSVVTPHEVQSWLGRRPGPGPFDLVLADPPYAFDDWDTLLDAAAELPVEVVVIESDRAVDPGGKWLVVREKSYGSTVVSIVRRVADDTETVPTTDPEA